MGAAMDERQRHELGEPARLGLHGPGPQQVPGPVPGRLDVAEHDGDVGAQPHRVGDPVDLQPLVGGHLVGADDHPHLVGPGGGAGQAGQPGREPQQVVAEQLARPAGALVGAVKPWMCMPGTASCTASATYRY